MAPVPVGQGGSEALTLVVTMTIKPEQEAAFLADAAQFVEKVYANEPDTLLYVLTKHPTLEHTYVWVERYRDVAAGDLHRNSSYMAEIRPRLEGYVESVEALRLEQVIPA